MISPGEASSLIGIPGQTGPVGFLKQGEGGMENGSHKSLVGQRGDVRNHERSGQGRKIVTAVKRKDRLSRRMTEWAFGGQRITGVLV